MLKNELKITKCLENQLYNIKMKKKRYKNSN